MRTKFTPLSYSILVLVLCSIVSIASSNGVGEQQNRDRSGSPDGDNTCGQCHDGGSFNHEISITVRDEQDNEVSTYIPGAIYSISYSIQSALPPFADAYGFQSTILIDSALSDAGEFFDPGFGVQIMEVSNATIQNRSVAEHSQSAPVGSFQVMWEAPNEDVGSVTIYAAGNAANGNGASSGDVGVETQITLLPDNSTGLFNLQADELTWYIQGEQLFLEGLDQTWDAIELWDMSGRLLFRQEQMATPAQVQLPNSSGVHGIRLIDGRGFVSRTIYLP